MADCEDFADLHFQLSIYYLAARHHHQHRRSPDMLYCHFHQNAAMIKQSFRRSFALAIAFPLYKLSEASICSNLFNVTRVKKVEKK